MAQTYPARTNPNINQGAKACSDWSDREAAVLKHSKLVKYTALRLVSRMPDHVAVEDLMSAGMLGLLDALEKYDPSQGNFECYAKIRIKGAMLDEVRSMDWVPRALRQKSAMLERACVALERRLGRDPSEDEIASDLNMSSDQLHKLLNEVKGICFLPESIHEMVLENREPITFSSAPEELFDAAYRTEIKQHLAEAIEGLSEREQLVLSLYYYEELTMKEIGATMGCTESRIHQIHTKAMLRLRTKLAARLKPDDLPGYIARDEVRRFKSNEHFHVRV